METEIELKTVLEKEVPQIVRQANDFEVKTIEDRSALNSIRKAMREKLKDLDERFHFTLTRTKAKEAYDQAQKMLRAFTDPFDQADEILKGKGQRFDTAILIKQQEDQKKADAAQREAERKEREKKEAQAEKELAKGNVEKAEALLDAADTVTVARKFTPTALPVSGSSAKLVWKARIKDPLAVCRAIADGKLWLNMIEFNQVALNRFAEGCKGQAKIEGLEFVQEAQSRLVR
jgi:hypothetical protein